MDFIDIIDINGLYTLIESIFGFVETLVHFFGVVFGWLGPGILVTISIGATIAIILRIIGR